MSNELQDENESDAYQKARDKETFQKVKRLLTDWGERSTFHGIDVLLETTPDWKRVFVVLFLMGMSGTCWICVGILVVSFLNLPISTVINNNQVEFQFPVVTICPDSPFSMEQLESNANMFEKYQKIAKFWMENAPLSSTPNATIWSQMDAEWRVRTKQSFLHYFQQNSTALSVPWLEFLVSCQYNGLECGIKGLTTVSIPIEASSGKEENFWIHNPAHETGYRDELTMPGTLNSFNNNNNRSAHFEGFKQNNEQLINQSNGIWSHNRPIHIPHSSKYYCYQFQVQVSGVRQSGPLGGLHLVFRRPYLTNKTYPALLYSEGFPTIQQGWDDHKGGTMHKDWMEQANEMDGFQILLHKNSQSPLVGALPTDDFFTAGSARGVAQASVRYGEHIRIVLDQYVHKRLGNFYRPCKKYMAPIKYLELKAFITSAGSIRNYFQISYTRNNCVSMMRQNLMIRKCGCLSENAFVPLFMADYLAQYGFCHSTANKQLPPNDVTLRAECHDHIARLTANEVLIANLPKAWKSPIIMKPTIQTEMLWLCPQFCTEIVNDIERKQVIPSTEKVPKDLVSWLNLSVDIEPQDVVVISVSAKETRVAVMSEGEQITTFNLLASIGGTFGLFLGLSGVTTFEVIEAWVIILSRGFSVFRHLVVLIKAYWQSLKETKAS